MYLTTVQRMTRPQPTTTERVLLRLIVVVGIVLAIAALVAIGAPEEVANLLRLWPIKP
jgi:hypothetical protein